MEEELIGSAFIHIAGLEEGRELRPGGTSNMLAVAMLSMLSLLAFARLVLGLQVWPITLTILAVYLTASAMRKRLFFGPAIFITSLVLCFLSMVIVPVGVVWK